MPIIDGVIIGRGQMEGCERSMQAAARKYGPAFGRAYRVAMTAAISPDPMMRKILTEMMRDADPGEFLMQVFGEDPHPAGMPVDAEVAAALKAERH